MDLFYFEHESKLTGVKYEVNVTDSMGEQWDVYLDGESPSIYEDLNDRLLMEIQEAVNLEAAEYRINTVDGIDPMTFVKYKEESWK